MSRSAKAVARVSQALAGYISSLSENENAATRALILLGAAELGIDPSLVDDDLRLTMAARLPPELYARLQAIRDRVDHRDRARGKPEAAIGYDGVRSPLHARSAAPPTPAAATEPIFTPVREPGVSMAEREPSAATSRSAERYDALHRPESQERAAVSHGSDQGDHADVITAPASDVSRMQSEHAAGDEEAFDSFSGIGFDFDAPEG
ncbi:MAG TPA: hypothetical protein VLA19_01540 [Herpetosiphonaceae bacterium]|nr:hypothetical protein [Herpetosiphonaceae bacterium]